MVHKLSVFLFSLFVVGAVAGCTTAPEPTAISDNVSPVDTSLEETAPADESVSADATLQVKEFTVDGSNFAFAPSELKVKEGDMVRVLFRNVEGFHDFVIDEFDARTAQIQEGEEVVIEFVANQKGEFEYYCSVGTHREMGMWGTLTVE